MRLLFLALFSATLLNAQEMTPHNGVKPSRAACYALTNATIVVSASQTIEKGTLLVQGDRIAAMGKSVKIPSDAVVVDCEGKTILPAFIETCSGLGLPSPVAVRSPLPQLETSKKGAYYWNEAIHPEVDASSLYAFDEKAASELVKMGFGLVSAHVNDGIMRGTGVLVSPGKPNDGKQVVKSRSAAYFSFRSGSSSQTYPSSQMGSIALIRQALYDLQWYEKNPGKEVNLSLDALSGQLKQPVVFFTEDRQEILRAKKIADEFGLSFAYAGSGNEYQLIQDLRKLKSTLILPLNFPGAYEVKDPYVARQIPLSDLKHWELAPSNPYLVRKEGLKIVLSSMGIASAADFWKNLQKAISRGLTPADALYALTQAPAELLGIQADFGTLETGKKASFTVYDGNPFRQEAALLESWLLGEQNVITVQAAHDIRGRYNLLVGGEKISLEIEGTREKPSAKLKTLEIKTDSLTRVQKTDTVTTTCFVSLTGNDLTLQFSTKNVPWKGSVSLHGKVNSRVGVFEGDGTLPDGKWVKWSAIRNKSYDKPDEKKLIKPDSIQIGKTWFPNMAFGFDSVPRAQAIVIEHATLWTNEAEGRLTDATIVIENGKIKSVGKAAGNIPAGALRIDAKGRHVTSGIIDEHSHIAISKGVNESGQSITSEVRIGDVVRADDINIYRQLSGGVTAAQLLHGSANTIGGQSALIKLKWGHSPEEMLIPGAPGFIKFALGENVKQANWGDYNTIRFPQTRMGVEQVLYDGFERAKKYQQDKEDKRKDKSALRVDLELEALCEILRGERFITCHSYVQSEINMLMHVADSMGFTVNTFTHILEGYKVADKMKKHGAGASTFSDWWGYKFEVNDAIPYNAVMLHRKGIVTAINSDDAEMGRRLNQEAAKTIKYGGLSEEEAWKLVTLNPARLLHLDDRMGSLRAGKDADIVIWSDNPLSILARVETTIVDGEILYDATRDAAMRSANAAERSRIISSMMLSNDKGEPAVPFVKKKKRSFHCNTLGEEGSEEVNEH